MATLPSLVCRVLFTSSETAVLVEGVESRLAEMETLHFIKGTCKDGGQGLSSIFFFFFLGVNTWVGEEGEEGRGRVRALPGFVPTK